MRWLGVRFALLAAGLVWYGAAFTARGSFGDDPSPSAERAARPVPTSAEPTSAEPKSKARQNDVSARTRHASKPESKQGACRKAEHGFTPEREAAALTFVQQHHPELAKLLPNLKKQDEVEYCRAIRDLFRTSERLAICREKIPERYDSELRVWQVKSRIQLLATRLKMTPDDAQLRKQLKTALLEHHDLRLQSLAEERRRMAERLERLDDQIDAMQSQKEHLADQQFRLLLRVPHKKPSSKQKANSGVKTKPVRPVKKPGEIEKPATEPDPRTADNKPE